MSMAKNLIMVLLLVLVLGLIDLATCTVPEEHKKWVNNVHVSSDGSFFNLTTFKADTVADADKDDAGRKNGLTEGAYPGGNYEKHLGKLLEHRSLT